MTLVVIGPVTADQVRPLAQATFGRLAGPPAARPPAAPVPSLAGGRRDDLARPEQPAHLGPASHAAATPLASDDMPAVGPLRHILRHRPSSRLHHASLQEKH